MLQRHWTLNVQALEFCLTNAANAKQVFLGYSQPEVSPVRAARSVQQAVELALILDGKRITFTQYAYQIQ